MWGTEYEAESGSRGKNRKRNGHRGRKEGRESKGKGTVKYEKEAYNWRRKRRDSMIWGVKWTDRQREREWGAESWKVSSGDRECVAVGGRLMK